MKESVIYILRSRDQVLCEWRDYKGTMQNCLPGGSVEPCDRQQDDHILAAVHREAEEELGIKPLRCSKLDDFVSNGIRFHVVLVHKWVESVPNTNRDNQNELHWVPLNTLIDSITLPSLKTITEGLKFT